MWNMRKAAFGMIYLNKQYHFKTYLTNNCCYFHINIRLIFGLSVSIYRVVFRTLSNIYEGVLLRK